jgi:hypothetical protein
MLNNSLQQHAVYVAIFSSRNTLQDSPQVLHTCAVQMRRRGCRRTLAGQRSTFMEAYMLRVCPQESVHSQHKNKAHLQDRPCSHSYSGIETMQLYSPVSASILVLL